MWFEKDYRWMLPIMGLVLFGMIAVTQWPQAGTWYDSKEEMQIKTISVSDLAHWIIQGRNDFVAVTLNSEDTDSINNIPGMIFLNPDLDIVEQLDEIPIYKKMVLLLSDEVVPPQTLKALTENWQRKIVILKGGVQTWNSQISAESIADLSLSIMEEQALAQIRPYFQPSLMESENNEYMQQEQYIAPETTSMPPLLEEEEEEEEEEGC